MQISDFQPFLSDERILDAIVNNDLNTIYSSLYPYLRKIRGGVDSTHVGKFTQLLLDSEIITLFGNLDIIPMGMFSNTPISDIKLPDSIKEIGSEAFSACVNLSTVEIPGSVKEISRQAFVNSGLTEVKLNEGLVEIGDTAFAVTPLKHVTIPASVKIIQTSFLFSEVQSVEFLGNSALDVLDLGIRNDTKIIIPHDADALYNQLRKSVMKNIIRKGR